MLLQELLRGVGCEAMDPDAAVVGCDDDVGIDALEFAELDRKSVV